MIVEHSEGFAGAIREWRETLSVRYAPEADLYDGPPVQIPMKPAGGGELKAVQGSDAITRMGRGAPRSPVRLAHRACPRQEPGGVATIPSLRSRQIKSIRERI